MATTFVFDAYGTLFDVHSAVARHADLLGPEAPAISALWRARQLEYSWVHGLADQYVDFWTLTRRSLRYALSSHGLDPDSDTAAKLLAAYETLNAYPEVPTVLDSLRARGARTAILSNATPAMLERAVAAAGLAARFDAVISVDPLRRYKPDPAVYRLVETRMELAPEDVFFQSSNAWDVAGASAFGFRTCWINRAGLPVEYPDMPPGRCLSDLRPLLELASAG
jgi:2-haloacid dehalogenase